MSNRMLFLRVFYEKTSLARKLYSEFIYLEDMTNFNVTTEGRHELHEVEEWGNNLG